MKPDLKKKMNTLINKDTIETDHAIDFLKNVNSEYLEARGESLRNKKLKEAKEINDEMAHIYLEISKKVKDDDVRKGLMAFAEYWLRSGETETFIEPSLPERIYKAPEHNSFSSRLRNIYEMKNHFSKLKEPHLFSITNDLILSGYGMGKGTNMNIGAVGSGTNMNIRAVGRTGAIVNRALDSVI